MTHATILVGTVVLLVVACILVREHAFNLAKTPARVVAMAIVQELVKGLAIPAVAE